MADTLSQAIDAADAVIVDATPPFIVRYRADATGGLDEQQVLAVSRALQEFEALQEGPLRIKELPSSDDESMQDYDSEEAG